MLPSSTQNIHTTVILNYYFRYTARIFLGVYSLTTVVLLTNLLISIFGKTYETDYDESQQLWQIQCYKVKINRARIIVVAGKLW